MPGLRTREPLITEDTERRSHSVAARNLALWLGETYSFCFLYKACTVPLNRRKLPHVLCSTSTHWNMWSDTHSSKPHACASIAHRARCSPLLFSFFFFSPCDWNPLWNEQHGGRVAGVSGWEVRGRQSQMKRMIVLAGTEGPNIRAEWVGGEAAEAAGKGSECDELINSSL